MKPAKDPEVPLHVKVAESLGWTGCFPAWKDTSHDVASVAYEGSVFPDVRSQSGYWVWHGIPAGEHLCPYAYENEPCECERLQKVPAYDTDWSVTGPLIEKYRLELVPCVQGSNCSVGDAHSRAWEAARSIDGTTWDETGQTALEAACRLIVALAADGHLDLP